MYWTFPFICFSLCEMIKLKNKGVLSSGHREAFDRWSMVDLFWLIYKCWSFFFFFLHPPHCLLLGSDSSPLGFYGCFLPAALFSNAHSLPTTCTKQSPHRTAQKLNQANGTAAFLEWCNWCPEAKKFFHITHYSTCCLHFNMWSIFLKENV